MKIYYTLLFIVSTYFIQAQTISSKIPLDSISSSTGQLEIQGLVINDSCFIAGHSAKNEPAKAFWILPNGKAVKIDGLELKNKLIVGLASLGDSTYLYYLKQFNNYATLNAIVQCHTTGIVITSKKQIVFTGSFVNIFHSGKQSYLLSILREKNAIHLIKIKGIERLSESVLFSPIDLNANTDQFHFISENETPSGRIAASPNKIYHRGDLIYISMDITKKINKSPAKTLIAKINLITKNTENRFIIDNSKERFRTYIQNDFIFKITKSRSTGAIVTIYNLNNFSLVQTVTINEESPIANNRSFMKDFTKTTDKESVWDAVSNNSIGFISATPLDSTNYIIRLGSQQIINNSNAGYIPVLSAFPILAIAGAVARVVAYSLSETESVDKYLYFSWDKKNKPVYEEKPISAIQVIDAYDVASFKKGKTFEYKGYLQRNSNILGIYNETGSAFVDIIIFTTP